MGFDFLPKLIHIFDQTFDCFDKILNFDQKFDYWPKLRYLKKTYVNFF